MLVHDVQEGLQIEPELKPFVFVSAAKSFAVQHGMTIKMSDEPVPGWRDLRAKSPLSLSNSAGAVEKSELLTRNVIVRFLRPKLPSGSVILQICKIRCSISI